MNLLSRVRRHITPIGELMTFSDPERSDYAEIHLTGTSHVVKDGLVQKEILRTGHWPVIPTRAGVLDRPLTVVRDGVSDQSKGLISLNEIYENFKRAGVKVQVPLSDDSDDHKNLTRLNTGFVEDLWIVDDEDGEGAKLVAAINFTEEDVKEKALSGTYSDVSCGIPWELVTRGQKYGTVLEHVAITNRPFIDKLSGFLAMSDRDPEKVDVVHFSEPGPPDPEHPDEPPPPKIVYREVDPFGGLSLLQIMEQAKTALPEAFAGFAVLDVSAKGLTIEQDGTQQKFLVPFKVEGEKVVPQPEGWTFIKTEAKIESDPPPPDSAPNPPVPEKIPAPVAPESFADPMDGELKAARTIREARLGIAASQSTTKEGYMPLSREELEALNLADMPEGQRAAFQKLIDENSGLAATSKTATADKRITELENLGLKDKPGALKLYRSVMLSDDGGPAVVLLSDDGKKKESLTALAILDQFIEAIKGAEGKVHLSDQAVLVPDDVKPPKTPESEKKPFTERLEEAKNALSGVNGR